MAHTAKMKSEKFSAFDVVSLLPEESSGSFCKLLTKMSIKIFSRKIIRNLNVNAVSISISSQGVVY